MRKYGFALFMMLALLINLIAQAVPSPTPTPKPTVPEMVKIKVTKKGQLIGPDGKVIDYRLFAFTTKDAEGKQVLEKGKARWRPKEMYIAQDKLAKNGLDDPKSADFTQYKEYMAAEKKVSKSIAKNTSTKRRHGKQARAAKHHLRKVKSLAWSANQTIKDLRQQVKNAEAQLDKANSDNNTLKDENTRLKAVNTDLQNQLEKVKQSQQVSPTPSAGSEEFKPWQPAWWNLWMFWDRGAISQVLDWNYTSLVIAWVCVIALLLLLILTVHWFIRKLRTGERSWEQQNYVSGQGIRGIKNDLESEQDTPSRFRVDIPQDQTGGESKPAKDQVAAKENGDEVKHATAKSPQGKSKGAKKGEEMVIKPAAN